MNSVHSIEPPDIIEKRAVQLAEFKRLRSGLPPDAQETVDALLLNQGSVIRELNFNGRHSLIQELTKSLAIDGAQKRLVNHIADALEEYDPYEYFTRALIDPREVTDSLFSKPPLQTLVDLSRNHKLEVDDLLKFIILAAVFSKRAPEFNTHLIQENLKILTRRVMHNKEYSVEILNTAYAHPTFSQSSYLKLYEYMAERLIDYKRRYLYAEAYRDFYQPDYYSGLSSSLGRVTPPT